MEQLVLWVQGYTQAYSGQLLVSVRHSTSVSSCKSSLKTFLSSETFSSVPLPYYTTLCVCLCVRALACARVCVCVWVCVRVVCMRACVGGRACACACVVCVES